MSISQSHGLKSLNKSPSLHVAPKTGASRSYGSVTAGRFDDVLNHLSILDSGAPSEPFAKVDIADAHQIDCPCCRQPVRVPTLEIVVDRYRVTPLEARILEAVWRGKGLPVMPERIFDAMYADDPDGGPTPTKMYLAFKVGLCHLRKKLAGSGVDIENVGYRRGYRLVLGG